MLCRFFSLALDFNFQTSSLKCQRVGEELSHHTGKEPQAPGVHQQQKYLAAEHTAPTLKDIGSGLRCAHGKGNRCGKHQHTEQHIALRRFKQQFDVIPSQNQYEDQCNQCHRAACTYAEYPNLCRQTDDDEQGGLTFEIDRRRFAVRLTAPYSDERRHAASELAKGNTNRLRNAK